MRSVDCVRNLTTVSVEGRVGGEVGVGVAFSDGGEVFGVVLIFVFIFEDWPGMVGILGFFGVEMGLVGLVVGTLGVEGDLDGFEAFEEGGSFEGFFLEVNFGGFEFEELLGVFSVDEDLGAEHVFSFAV